MTAVNQYDQALIQSAVLAGTNPTQLAYGSALAQQNMNTSFAISGQLAGEYMPVVYGIFSALFLAFSLFLIILMALPIGINYLKMYMELGLFLAVWPALMAVYNYVEDLIVRQGYTFFANQGYSLDSAHSVNMYVSHQLGIMGYLSWGVPMMAYALVSGSTYAMTSAVASLDSPAKSAAASGASAAASGNVNLGNDSLGNYSSSNRSMDNLSAMDVSTDNTSRRNLSENNKSRNNVSANNTSTDNLSANNTSRNNVSANNTSTDNLSANNTSRNNLSANNTSTDNLSANNTSKGSISEMIGNNAIKGMTNTANGTSEINDIMSKDKPESQKVKGLVNNGVFAGSVTAKTRQGLSNYNIVPGAVTKNSETNGLDKVTGILNTKTGKYVGTETGQIGGKSILKTGQKGHFMLTKRGQTKETLNNKIRNTSTVDTSGTKHDLYDNQYNVGMTPGILEGAMAYKGEGAGQFLSPGQNNIANYVLSGKAGHGYKENLINQGISAFAQVKNTSQTNAQDIKGQLEGFATLENKLYAGAGISFGVKAGDELQVKAGTKGSFTINYGELNQMRIDEFKESAYNSKAVQGAQNFTQLKSALNQSFHKTMPIENQLVKAIGKKFKSMGINPAASLTNGESKQAEIHNLAVELNKGKITQSQYIKDAEKIGDGNHKL